MAFLFSIHLTRTPMHILQFNAMPCRISDYAHFIACMHTMRSLSSTSTVFVLYAFTSVEEELTVKCIQKKQTSKV